MSDFKYAYEKLMAEHNLKVSDLPEDARVGITTINNIEKSMKMAEKQGKKVSDDTMSKIKANDKWIVQEILDHVEDTDDNEDEMPYDEEELQEELEEDFEEEGEDEGEEDNTPENEEQKKALGLTIDKELDEMFKTGKKQWGAEDIKGGYRNTYNTLFDNYEDDGENGVETSNFRLVETDHELFTITKK
ncbi:MAG: hypothetical protein WCI04_00400 [archaeon]